MAEKLILLVEGKDDKYVLIQLLNRHGLQDLIEIRDKEGVDQVKTGFERLLGELVTETKSSDKYLGIVVDADLDISARWQSLADRIRRIGYSEVPSAPSSLGTIIPSQQGLPKFGAWIMPDNVHAGILEDFIPPLVPPNRKELWDHAASTVDNIPAQFRLFHAGKVSKARAHTYLAWQEEPGKPFGVAIKSNYLTVESAGVENLISWIRRLFDLDGGV